jgi:hypothetical protein
MSLLKSAFEFVIPTTATAIVAPDAIYASSAELKRCKSAKMASFADLNYFAFVDESRSTPIFGWFIPFVSSGRRYARMTFATLDECKADIQVHIDMSNAKMKRLLRDGDKKMLYCEFSRAPGDDFFHKIGW